MKPNIIMLLIDDLGWKDLTCFGSDFYETPHIDALAKSGLQFMNAYASCPVCSPTRAAIMSGKYPARVGITQFIGGSSYGKLKDVPYLHYLPLTEKSLASTLKDNGYQTWHVGKWHLGDQPFYPTEHGFDINIGGAHMGHPPKGYFSPYGIQTLKDGPEGEYLTDRITDEAINLIKTRDSNNPFFLNLCHYAVHTPIEAPEDLIQKYERKAKDLGLDKLDPFKEGEHFSCEHKKKLRVKRRVIQSDASYAAMIENLDTNIGKLLTSLNLQGLTENTIVIFTSDNGGLSTAEGSPTCNAPLLEGKGWNYEGGTRISQIISWPAKIRANRISNEVTTSTDFYPTLLDLIELPLMPEQHQDGISIKKHILNNERIDREAIYWHYPHYSNQGGTPSASMVMGDWKLIHRFEDNNYQLYNLKEDISETTSVISKNETVFLKMKKMLSKWQDEIEAKMPAQNPGYQCATITPKVANNAYD